MDDRLRKLERAALSGGIPEKAAYLREAVRAGWPLVQIEAAADLHHEPSEIVLGISKRSSVLQSSLEAILLDTRLDPVLLKAILVDILLYIKETRITALYGQGAKYKKLWPKLYGTLKPHERQKFYELFEELRTDSDRGYAQFGYILESLIRQGKDPIGFCVVLQRIRNMELDLGLELDHNVLRGFFLNRLLPSAAV